MSIIIAFLICCSNNGCKCIRIMYMLYNFFIKTLKGSKRMVNIVHFNIKSHAVLQINS